MSTNRLIKLLRTTTATFASRGLALVVVFLTLDFGLAMAQTSGQITAALASTDAPAVIDRLILSPIQRKNLEFVRRAGNSDALQQAAGEQLLDGGATVSENIMVSGIVIRSDNRSTVWVNDQPLYGQGGESALRAQAKRVGVLGSGKQGMQAKAKPGQTVDVKTRQATDLLPPGSIKIIPPKVGTGNSAAKE